MTLAAAERQALLPVVDDLMRAVEEIVGTGLSAASKSTLERLDLAFKEAARLKLGRLAASLRYANDEIGRYVAQSPDFNARRLALFLNRSWVVAQGLDKAIRANDEAMLGRLLRTPPAPEPLPSIDLVVLGVQKRASRSNASFEFRMREIGGARDGRPLTWSFVAARQTAELTPEAFLYLPQPQKFEPKVLLEGTLFTATQVAVASDGRLLLGPKATVTPGKRFTDFERLLVWDRAAAVARVKAHVPSPLDLEVELQEEVALGGWTVGEAVDRGRTGFQTFPILWEGLELEVHVSTGEEGKELASALGAFRTAKDRPPLFGLMHYELCRLIFAPLATHEGGKMRQLMLSNLAIDRKKLVKAITF